VIYRPNLFLLAFRLFFSAQIRFLIFCLFFEIKLNLHFGTPTTSSPLSFISLHPFLFYYSIISYHIMLFSIKWYCLSCITYDFVFVVPKPLLCNSGKGIVNIEWVFLELWMSPGSICRVDAMAIVKGKERAAYWYSTCVCFWIQTTLDFQSFADCNLIPSWF
jgi:hypothetical protein